jgi:hypothetical protein
VNGFLMIDDSIEFVIPGSQYDIVGGAITDA